NRPGRQTRGKPAMNLVRLLLRSSRQTTLLAVAAGLAGGACSVGLIAPVQAALGSGDPPPRRPPRGLSRPGPAAAPTPRRPPAPLIRRARGPIARLYTHLSREILALPLPQFEKVGSHRLLAALTEDVPAIAGALVGAPIVCVNAAILLCCLLYLGWLSPLLLL